MEELSASQCVRCGSGSSWHMHFPLDGVPIALNCCAQTNKTIIAFHCAALCQERLDFHSFDECAPLVHCLRWLIHWIFSCSASYLEPFIRPCFGGEPVAACSFVYLAAFHSFSSYQINCLFKGQATFFLFFFHLTPNESIDRQMNENRFTVNGIYWTFFKILHSLSTLRAFKLSQTFVHLPISVHFIWLLVSHLNFKNNYLDSGCYEWKFQMNAFK